MAIGLGLTVVCVAVIVWLPRHGINLWLGFYSLGGIVLTALLFHYQVILGALVLVFTVVVSGLWAVAIRRTRWTAVMIRGTVQMVKRYPGTLAASLLTSVLYCVFGALWVVSLDSLVYLESRAPQRESLAYNGDAFVVKLYGISLKVCFLLFTLLFVPSVLTATLHTTLAGVFATDYFVRRAGREATSRYPALAAWRRSVTWSFGSVCFGALFQPLFTVVRAFIWVVSCGRRRHSQSTSALQFVDYFNHYAYVQVAVYGKPFATAGADTWKVLQAQDKVFLASDELIRYALVL
ncbi:putative choline transporter, neither null mutation nor overexpression affects choline transport, partial [Dimargaris xerosporica]